MRWSSWRAPICCDNEAGSELTGTQIRNVAFVLRCSGAATLSYILSQAIGLPHPVWAAMSSVIVSQDRLGDTRQATIGRFIGTLVGVIIAVIVGTLAQGVGAGTAVEIATAVGLAAIAARRFPLIKVCMWTCPIVFLTATAGTPLWQVGLFRGAEVLLGATIGVVLHLLAEAVLGTGHISAAPDGTQGRP